MWRYSLQVDNSVEHVHNYKYMLIKAARLQWNNEHVLLAHTEKGHNSIGVLFMTVWAFHSRAVKFQQQMHSLEWPTRWWSSFSFVCPHLGVKLSGKRSKIFTAAQFSIMDWVVWKIPPWNSFPSENAASTELKHLSGKHGFHPKVQWIIPGIFTLHNSIVISEWNNIRT